jgi:hypothetical protein
VTKPGCVVYAVADKVDGSLLQDSIEQAYFAFRNIKQANSCEYHGLQPDAESRRQVRRSSRRVHAAKMSGREELRRPGRDAPAPAVVNPPSRLGESAISRAQRRGAVRVVRRTDVKKTTN